MTGSSDGQETHSSAMVRLQHRASAPTARAQPEVAVASPLTSSVGAAAVLVAVRMHDSSAAAAVPQRHCWQKCHAARCWVATDSANAGVSPRTRATISQLCGLHVTQQTNHAGADSVEDLRNAFARALLSVCAAGGGGGGA